MSQLWGLPGRYLLGWSQCIVGALENEAWLFLFFWDSWGEMVQRERVPDSVQIACGSLYGVQNAGY